MRTKVCVHTLLMYTAQKDEPLKSLLEFGQQLSLFGGQFQCHSKLLSKFQKGVQWLTLLYSKEVVQERFTVCGVLWSSARLFHYTATPPIEKPFKKLTKGPLPINIMRESNQLQILYPLNAVHSEFCLLKFH